MTPNIRLFDDSIEGDCQSHSRIVGKTQDHSIRAIGGAECLILHIVYFSNKSWHIAYFCINMKCKTLPPRRVYDTTHTSAAPSTHRKRRAAARQQAYSRLRTRRKQKKRKKRLFGGTWCVVTLWNRTVAWSVAGRRVAAAAGVYIENNRGGCFDARFSAAVSKTHRQCRKWEYGSTWTSLDHLGIRGYSPGSFGNLVGEIATAPDHFIYIATSMWINEQKKENNMIRRSVDYRQDLTNQIRLCKFLVGDTPSVLM